MRGLEGVYVPVKFISLISWNNLLLVMLALQYRCDSFYAMLTISYQFSPLIWSQDSFTYVQMVSSLNGGGNWTTQQKELTLFQEIQMWTRDLNRKCFKQCWRVLNQKFSRCWKTPLKLPLCWLIQTCFSWKAVVINYIIL